MWIQITANGNNVSIQIFHRIFEVINKLLGKETTLTKDMWEDTKARVSDKKVESIFNSFY